MEQIHGVLGNKHDDAELAEAVEEHDRQGTLERLVIEAGKRKRSRIRAETDHGTDVGLVLDENLRAGDVLVLDDDRAIIVAFEEREAAVIGVPEPTEVGVVTAVELGHRIGNQHWDLAVENGAIYVPADADRHIIEDVLADSLPAGSEIRYETVDPALWIDDGETTEHSHESVDHGHSHHDGADHSHEHSHGDGEHSHEHSHGNHGDAEHSHEHSHGNDDHSHGHEHSHPSGGEKP